MVNKQDIAGFGVLGEVVFGSAILSDGVSDGVPVIKSDEDCLNAFGSDQVCGRQHDHEWTMRCFLALKKAVCKAFEEVRDMAVHENCVEIAKTLINMQKNTVQEIAQATGLTVEKVEALAQLQPA